MTEELENIKFKKKKSDMPKWRRSLILSILQDTL